MEINTLIIIISILITINQTTSDRIMDPYRTAFHFQPPAHWMNDPNGPMIYKGIYHFFYQYYPRAASWTKPIEWGHSTSTDLINWTHQPSAIISSEPYDIQGCWSGSATLVNGQPTILYTGGDTNQHQLQNLAFPKDPSDPYLLEWVKSGHNPVITGQNSNKINQSEFRDPTTAWKLPDGRWRVVIGTIIHDGFSSAVLFTSDDFTTWVESDRSFHSGNGRWECVDFFSVGENGAYVFKVSLQGPSIDYYTIGRYDTDEDVYVPNEGSIDGGHGLRFDYGRFYASKSFFDDEIGRRIVWAWITEGSSVEDAVKRGWQGLQGIPRTIELDKSGKQLILWPVIEVERLRGNQVDLAPRVLNGGSRVEISGVTASQMDVEVSFKIPNLSNLTIEEFDPSWINPQELCTKMGASIEGGLGPFGLLALASQDLQEYTAVFFRIFKGPNNNYVVLMCSDQSKSSLNPTTDKTSYGTFVDMDPTTEELTLRILIDHSIVESFGAKGKNCITARVYPTLAINNEAHLFAFNHGKENIEITKLTAWSMNRANMNVNGSISSSGLVTNENENQV